MTDREEVGRQAAVNGRAHEHLVVGILMKRYHNVSLVDLLLSPYDIVIVRKREGGTEDIIRAQVKTVTKGRVNFRGGTRGGVDRTYKSGVKEYIQSTETSDVVIGIRAVGDDDRYELYFVPTILVEALGQGSISVNRIQAVKENYEMLENCKDAEFVITRGTEYGILKPSSLF